MTIRSPENPVLIPSMGNNIRSPAITAVHKAQTGASRKVNLDPCAGNIVSFTRRSFRKS